LRAALATIAVYEEDALIENARGAWTVMRGLLEDTAASHRLWVRTAQHWAFSESSSWCEIARRVEPMAPFNGTSPRCKRSASFFVRKVSTRLSVEYVLHEPAALHH